VARGPFVLIIDDDPGIRTLLRRGLRAAGYRARDVEPGQGALECLAAGHFDLIVLNIDCPVGSGPDPIWAVRELSPMPILALSVRAKEEAMVKALDTGADDYVQKPFGMEELLARVRALLRRQAREQGRPAQFVVVSGDLEIDLLHRRVRSRGHEIHLEVKPYEVLRVLAEGADRVLTHDAILRAVWGARRAERVQLRMAIWELRRKLEADPAHPQYIVTEVGVGYRLDVRKRDKHNDQAKASRADGEGA
jgi:two-component system KDP operon response regulator KdpE